MYHFFLSEFVKGLFARPELVPHLPVLTWIEAHIYAIDDANEDSLRPGACRI